MSWRLPENETAAQKAAEKDAGVTHVRPGGSLGAVISDRNVVRPAHLRASRYGARGRTRTSGHRLDEGEYSFSTGRNTHGPARLRESSPNGRYVILTRVTLPELRERWMALARRAARVQSHILLFAFYYLAFVPAALVLRPFLRPFGQPKGPGSAWLAKRPLPTTIDAARRQF